MYIYVVFICLSHFIIPLRNSACSRRKISSLKASSKNIPGKCRPRLSVPFSSVKVEENNFSGESVVGCVFKMGEEGHKKNGDADLHWSFGFGSNMDVQV